MAPRKPDSISPPKTFLPRIEILRCCLLSGGVYKHREASKVDVAESLIRGLLKANIGNEFTLDFAYDEDVFFEAWKKLGLPRPEGCEEDNDHERISRSPAGDRPDTLDDAQAKVNDD